MSQPLSDLQKWMHGALLQPDATLPQEAAARLTPNPRLSAADSLAIYQRSYALRIASCMREQFPALCHALGAELFNDFVADYVRDAPPESYTLYDLGRRFAAFLEANRPDRDAPQRETWIDFIVDLARFERAVFTTFDGPGAEDMVPATPDTPDTALFANPSLSVDRYRFLVARYYHQVRDGQTPQPAPAQPCNVAILRKDYLTSTIQMSDAQSDCLRALQTGASFAQAVASLPNRADVDHVRQSRASWIAAGVFVAEQSETVRRSP